ncbi:asparagine synthase (glutamine-hydrolyzing) [Salmonirosea aquatica]|uniref:asparagine synthase (glutamine-hydrolyzing) n=1 Tax=Salmonirosea aquatica TaxID=2654236 RepID=A0A7C9FY72_9BACT|nr:asparagine synthase (glutamine-hydrolyzing) [Cytophagaceae bacterium SJW1-29]
MCGIAGIVGLDPKTSRELIQGMTDSLSHRGPDAVGFFIDYKVAFGQRRLSIIDLSTGANQPFFDITKRYAIIFNGEIYNYQEVREQLNYSWQTKSDTEVILAAFIKWGKDCLSHLNGMFAFAIWDSIETELFIARDRLGVKPLYYYMQDDLFVFSSEVRSILRTGLVSKKVCTNAIVSYLAGLAVKTPYSIIENIFQLLPGEYAFLKKGKLDRHYYWRIDNAKKSEPSILSLAETVKKTRLLFEAAIKSRMVADVPVGAFLSGGIDSSAIVALMSKFSQRPVETFSIIFENKEFDESVYARKIADKYSTKHTELLLSPTDLIDSMHEYIAAMDTPTVDGINSYMVSKLVAATGIKVAVSGLGGDELFVGYPGFTRWKQIKQYNALHDNPFFRSFVSALNKRVKSRAVKKVKAWKDNKQGALKAFYETNRGIFLEDEIRELLEVDKEADLSQWMDLNGSNIRHYPTYSQYSVAELTGYTLDVLLKDSDQMSMAWGLEVREPFFDYHLVEFILSVPDKYKYSRKTPKSLFVKAMGDLLPDEIVYRPKKGFAFPWDSWLRGELKDYCESKIQNLSNRDLFNKASVLDLWKRFLTHDRRVKWMHVWSLVILEGWLTVNEI